MKRSKTVGFFREARTRIFLTYVAFMLIAVGLSIPIFRTLLFSAVNERVNQDLLEEVEEFDAAYTEWLQSDNSSLASFKTTLDNYLSSTLPEDDNFLIAVVDGDIYRSNPVFLPDAINVRSELFEEWTQIEENTQGKAKTGDPNIGDVLYVIEPLSINGELRGQFVSAHISAGERQEALAGVYVFVAVAGGLIVLALVLAWLTTGQLLKPVQDLAVTARAINETDLNSRIAVVGTGELAALATTFNAMMDRLQGAFNSQRNFINDAGHELRTPITIMQGHLELMGDDPVEQAETKDLMLDELDRMGRLVNDLILIVKSENPNFLRFETVDVADLCSHLFANAQTLADRDWQLTIETRVKIVADPQRLTGALLNLLHNAAQHTQPNDRITLGCRDRNGHVELWVADTGEGIPEIEQARVFDRFARVQYTHRKSDGSGLGLAIVRAIVESHGGRVGLSSQVGMGSVFTLVLPVEQPLVLTAYQEAR